MTVNDTIDFYLIDILYTNVNGLFKLILIGRSFEKLERINLIISNFNPYFYVDQNNVNQAKINKLIHSNVYVHNWINKDHLEISSKNTYFRTKNIQLYKIYGKEPFKLPEIKEYFSKEGFNCFEYDIPFIHRFLIDSGIYCGHVYSLPADLIKGGNEKPLSLEVSWTDLQATKKETTATPFLIAAIDIETANDEDISFQELQSNKEHMIIAIGISYGYYSDDTALSFDCQSFILDRNMNEKGLLKTFLAFLDKLDPDCIVTFNGDNFDLPYIEHRLNLYDLEFKFGVWNQKFQKSNIDGRYRISGRSVIDLYPKTWNIHTKSGKKRLVDITEYFFPDNDQNTKLSIPKLPGSLFKESQITLLQNYVEQDVKLTFQLFHKLFSGEIAIVKINGAPYSDVLLSTQRVNGEFLLMRILYEKNVIIPSKPKKRQITSNKQERKEHPHTGGQVITPKVTTAENVIIADFVSMYPTLIRAENIGSETFISENTYKKDSRSSLALLQDRVITKRIKIKNILKENKLLSANERNSLQNQQKALKLVANSMYGATLYVQGRFFDIEVCNSITFMARSLMNSLFEKAKLFGVENALKVQVIYSDTDSVFIQIKAQELEFTNNSQRLSWIIPVQEKLLHFINSIVPTGMELSLEDIANRIIFQKMKETGSDELRKKAYAYYSLLHDQLVIKGFEAIRQDLAEITKKTQEKLFYILLNEGNPEEKAQKYLKSTIKYITSESEDSFLEKALYSGIIRRAPSKYKSLTPAVGAFLDYCRINDFNPEIHYQEFPRFPYAIVKGKRSDPLFKRSKHPSIIKKFHFQIDRHFYIQEILRIAERFELKNPLNSQTSLFDFI